MCAGGLTGGDIALARADVPRASADPAAATEAGAAISALGLDLYRAIAKGQPNVVLSPTSIALALAMARAGARGQTATEMDAVMRDLGADENAAWLNALDAALATRSGTFKDDSGRTWPSRNRSRCSRPGRRATRCRSTSRCSPTASTS